jgi:hypothetical protein
MVDTTQSTLSSCKGLRTFHQQHSGARRELSPASGAEKNEQRMLHISSLTQQNDLRVHVNHRICTKSPAQVYQYIYKIYGAHTLKVRLALITSWSCVCARQMSYAHCGCLCYN